MNEGFKAVTAQDLIKMYNLDALVAERKQNKARNEEIKNVSALVKDFADTINGQIKELEDQVDGKISTWFFSGIPSSTTEPEVNWLTDEEKSKHVGDIYYDQDTGNSYTYMYKDGSYQWKAEAAGDVSEVLAIANKAQDTADRKRQIFVVQPYPPYEVGDMWIKDDKDIYRCRAKRTEGSFSETDWKLASDYTNDDYAKGVEAQLNVFKDVVSTDYVLVTSFESSVEGLEAKVSSTTTVVEEVKANLVNDYYDKSEIDFTTQNITENVTQVTKQVTELTTDTKKTLTFMEDVQINGVKQVRTENEFTFNSEGLRLEKDNAKTTSLLDECGLDIANAQGEKNTLLYAGYVDEEKASEEEKFKKYEGQTIVYSDNQIIENYLVIGKNSRIEDYETSGTGVFPTGG